MVTSGEMRSIVHYNMWGFNKVIWTWSRNYTHFVLHTNIHNVHMVQLVPEFTHFNRRPGFWLQCVPFCLPNMVLRFTTQSPSDCNRKNSILAYRISYGALLELPSSADDVVFFLLLINYFVAIASNQECSNIEWALSYLVASTLFLPSDSSAVYVC